MLRVLIVSSIVRLQERRSKKVFNQATNAWAGPKKCICRPAKECFFQSKTFRRVVPVHKLYQCTSCTSCTSVPMYQLYQCTSCTSWTSVSVQASKWEFLHPYSVKPVAVIVWQFTMGKWIHWIQQSNNDCKIQQYRSIVILYYYKECVQSSHVRRTRSNWPLDHSCIVTPLHFCIVTPLHSIIFCQNNINCTQLTGCNAPLFHSSSVDIKITQKYSKDWFQRDFYI